MILDTLEDARPCQVATSRLQLDALPAASPLPTVVLDEAPLVMQLDCLPSDAGRDASRGARAVSARIVPQAASARVVRRAATSVARRAAAIGAKKVKRGVFKDQRGAEYAKHLAFRRDWAFVLQDGSWERHPALQKAVLRGLTPREVDLLHILWLVLERNNIDPRTVDQAWLLCQSICREGGPYPPSFFRGRLPGTPGFRLRLAIAVASAAASGAGSTAASAAASGAGALAPCVLPRGKLWLNATRRLASAADVLQLQGVHVPSSIPWWRQVDASALRSIAGNAFTMPVIACHCAVAFLALASGGAKPRLPGVAASARPPMREYTSLPDFESLARGIYDQLALCWPHCLINIQSSQSISLGTLCSGGDLVVPLSRALVAALGSLCSISLTVMDAFACEANPEVRAFRERALGSCGPCLHDVHHLPLDSMQPCDLLVFGSSCKSLSQQNHKPRSLNDTDASDPAASSGSTLRGCFSYIEKHHPKIVIMENVTRLLGPVSRGSATRNVDVVASLLDPLGYTHGYGVFDSCDFLVPQSRARVYLWAARREYASWVPVWHDVVSLCRPRGRLPLSACLL